MYLDRQSLWGDEAASLAYALSPDVPSLVQWVLAADPHPPLYYITLHLWTQVGGTSDFALRWPSLAFGLLTVALAYAFARRLFGAGWTPCLLALLAALSPFLVYYSQEARMYSMAGFLCLLALYAVVRALQSNGWWWLVYGGASVAATYTLSTSIAPVGAASFFALWGFWRHWWGAPRKTALAWSGSVLVLMAAFLFWHVLQLGQFGQFVSPVTLSQLPILTVDTLKEVSLASVFGLTLDPAYSAARIYEAISAWEQVYQPPFTSLAAVMVLSLAGWGAISSRRTEGRTLIWLLVACLLASWGAAFLLRLTTTRYAPRLGLVSAPLLLALLSLGVARLPARSLRALAALILAAGMGYALWGNYQNPAFARSEYRLLAQYLDQELEPEDGVYLHGPVLRLLHSHYLPRPHPVYAIPRGVPVPSNWQEVEAQLQSLAERHPRLWLALGGEVDYDPERRVESWLLEHGYQVEDQWYGNSRLALFVFPKDPGLEVTAGRRVAEDLALVESAFPRDREFPSGGSLPLDFTWRRLSPTDRVYRLSLRLTDAGGQLWAQRDLDLGAYVNPVVRWPVGPTVGTRTGLRVPPGTPPGDYFVKALVYESADQPLPEGELIAVAVQVTQGPPVSAQLLRPPNRADLTLGSLRVIGYYFPQRVLPGESAVLRLYWAAEAAPPEDYSLVVRLGAGPEQVLSLLPAYPTSRWRGGEALVS
ncbi:MAG TPA: glycosyltransferase family 39 protein, partial [Dehalococcoidia bacterium]|nr:glycosyltransferase family 39 protein [Dehalococcoidia bacterium]